MPENVDFLATFDVLYQRAVLASLHGFDERYLKGQDAEFVFRVIEAGHALHFDQRSIVQHHHADRLSRYLAVQRQQGYWRVALHLEHRGRDRHPAIPEVVARDEPDRRALAIATANGGSDDQARGTSHVGVQRAWGCSCRLSGSRHVALGH